MPEAPVRFRRFGGVLTIGAGLLGAVGVVLSAVAAHLAGGSSLGVAGSFCILHGAAVLAIGLGGMRSRVVAAAGLFLLAGAVLFAAGVSVQALAGVSPGPVAPAGGMALIAGWLLVAFTGATSLRTETSGTQP